MRLPSSTSTNASSARSRAGIFSGSPSARRILSRYSWALTCCSRTSAADLPRVPGNGASRCERAGDHTERRGDDRAQHERQPDRSECVVDVLETEELEVGGGRLDAVADGEEELVGKLVSVGAFVTWTGATVAAALLAIVMSLLFPTTLALQVTEVQATAPQGIMQVLGGLLQKLVDNPVNAILTANYIGILVWGVLLGVFLHHALRNSGGNMGFSALGGQRRASSQRMGEHRHLPDRVQNLGQVRFHPGSHACGQDYKCRFFHRAQS